MQGRWWLKDARMLGKHRALDRIVELQEKQRNKTYSQATVCAIYYICMHILHSDSKNVGNVECESNTI